MIVPTLMGSPLTEVPAAGLLAAAPAGEAADDVPPLELVLQAASASAAQPVARTLPALAQGRLT
jgi:hypothetical protein